MDRDGRREVFFELNGQLRSVYIRDSEATKVNIYWLTQLTLVDSVDMYIDYMFIVFILLELTYMFVQGT